MGSRSNETGVLLHGLPHRKHVVLEDVNMPYNFAIDRNNNSLFFCINADGFSDQSFQSVVLNLDTGQPLIIPGIRNGFASTVDQATGDVYLGGSNGIFTYNYCTNSIVQPALVSNIDILDMFFYENLYFVDTGSQNLHVYKDNKNSLVDEMQGNLLQHFVFDVNHDLYYVSASGLFVLHKGNKYPELLDTNDMSIQGACIDVYGSPYFITNDGIYGFDKENKRLWKELDVNNGNAIAFDKNNNIIYSEGRTVTALIPY